MPTTPASPPSAAPRLAPPSPASPFAPAPPLVEDVDSGSDTPLRPPREADDDSDVEPGPETA
jgi:hypothetical protein